MFKRRDSLGDRLEAKRKELEARLEILAAEARDREIREIREALADLGAAEKHGYENLTELAARRINEILGSRIPS